MNWYDEQALQELEETDRLVIDEVGAEYGDSKNYYLTQLRQLVTTRFDDDRLTTLTSNLRPEELEELLGDRVWRRIVECGRIYLCVHKTDGKGGIR